VQWGAEQNSSTSQQWAGIDWIANPPPDWNPEWTAWGLVPTETARARSNPAGIAELKKVAAAAIGCAKDIWDSRIEHLKEWEASIPGLADRKTQAGRARWRPSNPTPRKGRKRKEPETPTERRTQQAQEESKKRRLAVEEQAKKRSATAIAGALPR
jgi:hypothetical protein